MSELFEGDVPLLVHVSNVDEFSQAMSDGNKVEEAAAPHAVANTWGSLPALGTELTQSNVPVEILPLDVLRKRAVITLNGSGQVIICHSEGQAQSLQQNVQQAADEGCLITVPGAIVHESSAALWAVAVPASSPQNTQGATGSATAPGAGAVIATIPASSLPAGSYDIFVTVYFDGTVVPATDDDNWNLTITLLTISHLIAPGVINVPETYGPFKITVNGAQAINVKTIIAGSAACVYHAQVTATPDPYSPTSGVVQVGTLTERRDS